MFNKFIGQTFTVQGFNEPRTVRVVAMYPLGGRKRLPAFKCQVVGNYKYFKDGERENFLCKEVIKNGKFRAVVRVLTA